MAIYHLEANIISRSQGRSAVASASYRATEKILDERTNITHDYTKKSDLLHQEILLPKNAPEWMGDRAKLWNAVEQSEKRKDSQLSREFNIALPRELTDEQRIALAKEFVQTEFVDRGMVADLCLHTGHKCTQDQPHAHVMLTLRKVDQKGFGLKEIAWNQKALLEHWREAWANTCNRHLALNGHDVRIDHRTLEAQGINLEAQTKIGPKEAHARMVRFQEHQELARRNGERILNDPNIALHAITRQQSTFTHQDLARFVNRHTVDAEQFETVYQAVKHHDTVVSLGRDDRGRERFSTQAMLDLEKDMLARSKRLNDTQGHAVAPAQVAALATAKNLSEQQHNVLMHIAANGDLKCVVGYAGTGKSYLLGAAREAWEAQGYRVHGVTLSGIAAENLQGSSGIESRTLASRSYYWDRGDQRLTSRDVLVVDEAGMLGSHQMAQLLAEAERGGAKIVLIGDPQQLQAIEAGAAFRAISEQVPTVELTEVRRQKEAWQQEATKEFALRQTPAALARYEAHDHIHSFETQAVAKQALVEMWNEVRLNNPEQTQIMLAYTRVDAKEINALAREQRKALGELGDDHKVETAKGERHFARGERVYFLQNDRTLGVKNGTLGTLTDIQGSKLCIRLDKDMSQQADKSARTITIDTKLYNHIDHGYAATIHKAQGVTVDRSYVLASKYMDSHATYVAMSRHRDSAELFYSREEFPTLKELGASLSRERLKDVSLDYSKSGFAKQRGIDDWQEPQLLTTVEHKKQIQEKTKTPDSLEAFKARYQQKHPEMAALHKERINPSSEHKFMQEIASYQRLKECVLQDKSSPTFQKEYNEQLIKLEQLTKGNSYATEYITKHCKDLQQDLRSLKESRELSRNQDRGISR